MTQIVSGTPIGEYFSAVEKYVVWLNRFSTKNAEILNYNCPDQFSFDFSGQAQGVHSHEIIGYVIQKC